MSTVQAELFPIHFVGIGGIGMSGIAEIFFNRGFPVSGSDAGETETTRRLKSLGIPVRSGHSADAVQGKKVVVVSSAIRPDNPEVVEARRLRIPVIRRAEMLGELMRGKTGVALAGTHGKTTTTSLTSCILHDAGLDPTCVIGGKVDALGGNAKVGKGSLLVAEADESDGSFLHLPATYAIITNIDNDHLDHFGSQEQIDQAFISFANQIPFYGRLFVCGDDPGIQRILPSIERPVSLYGTGVDSDFQARAIELTERGSRFQVWKKEDSKEICLGSVDLPIPGRHNVLNALGVLALCLHLGVKFDEITTALSRFAGVRRRFDQIYSDPTRKIRVIDDYGHHPTEVAATLEAARGIWGKGRIICVFQPHRYSRTRSCMSDFASAFSQVDHLLLTDIYSAGEEPLPGVSSESLLDAIRASPRAPGASEKVPSLEAAQQRVLDLVQDGDLILCMGAGTITKLPLEIRNGLMATVSPPVPA